MKLRSIAVAIALVLPLSVSSAEDAIGKIMKDHFKGDTSNVKKAVKGELDKDTLAKLADACKKLCTEKPHKGDAASWKTKTDALVAALDSLSKGEAGAGEKLKAAANCKACHDAHKEDKK